MREESAARDDDAELAWSTAVRLAPDVHAPAASRRLVESVLGGEPDIEVVALLASELVTNAVRHGRGSSDEIEVGVSGGVDGIRVEVVSAGTLADRPAESPGGFGLLLVDRLADDWGIEDAGSGRVRAWFRTDAV